MISFFMLSDFLQDVGAFMLSLNVFKDTVIFKDLRLRI